MTRRRVWPHWQRVLFVFVCVAAIDFALCAYFCLSDSGRSWQYVARVDMRPFVAPWLWLGSQISGEFDPDSWSHMFALAVNAVLVGALAAGFYAGPAFLRGRRVPDGTCAHCGYDLRGIDSNKCPECGAPR